MTIDQVCGWEHGVLSGEGGGTVTSITGTGMSIDSTVQRSGSFCLKGNGSGGETIANTASPVNNSTTISGSFYFKWNILSNVITSVCRIYTAAGSTARINFDPSDQKIFGRYVSNGPKVDLVLEQDVWYRIDYKADVSDNPNKLWYNVNAVGEQYTEYAQSATNFTSTVYGMIESTPTITQGIYYWDDCLASDDMNDYPIGAHMVAGLSPVTNSPTSNPGTVIKDTGGTLVDDGTNPAYVELDDTPPLTSTADYIQQDGTGDYYAEVPFESMPSGSPIAVEAYMSYTSSSTTANNGEFRIRDSDGQETSIFDGDMSVTTLSYEHKIVLDPSGGWTEAHVNALKGRVGYSTNVTTYPHWQSLLLEVAYAEDEEICVNVVNVTDTSTATVPVVVVDWCEV